LLNGLTQRPGGGLVILEALLTGIAQASEAVRISVLVYDERVYSTLHRLGYSKVNVVRLPKVNDLVDKFVVPLRLRSAVSKHPYDLLITLNFFIPAVEIPQIVYHVDMERFEFHSLLPFSFRGLLEKIRDQSARRALVCAQANVFESEFLRKTAEEYSALQINNPKVIYIGIDNTSVIQTDSAICTMEDGLIVAVTSPNKYKNAVAMVPVVLALREEMPAVNWRIRIFGGEDQSSWSRLVQVATEAGVEESFEFMGYQSREVLNASLDLAICQLNTSRLESFCMVALEAMARGCPVIVSGDAAMPESVGNAGVIVDPDETDKIVEKILRLRSDSKYRLEIRQRSIEWAASLTWESSGEAFYRIGCSLTGSVL